MGRTRNRHALREAIAHERYDRLVVAAAAAGRREGLHSDEITWLLDHAPGEVVVIRSDERRVVRGTGRTDDGSPCRPQAQSLGAAPRKPKEHSHGR